MQVHRNENNGLKQQAPACEEQPRVWLDYWGRSMHVYIRGLLCAYAAGPRGGAGGVWGGRWGGGLPGREQKRVYIF